MLKSKLTFEVRKKAYGQLRQKNLNLILGKLLLV